MNAHEADINVQSISTVDEEGGRLERKLFTALVKHNDTDDVIPVCDKVSNNSSSCWKCVLEITFCVHKSLLSKILLFYFTVITSEHRFTKNINRLINSQSAS